MSQQQEPIVINCECGCRMIAHDEGEEYRVEYDWCKRHKKMADTLRGIIEDFDLLLDHIIHERKKART